MEEAGPPTGISYLYKKGCGKTRGQLMVLPAYRLRDALRKTSKYPTQVRCGD
jgi:hypothetical protein